MKRDKNFICELLQMLEAAATDRGFSFEEGEAETLKRPLDEINYNLEQAEQMGLIKVLSKPLQGRWIIGRPTPTGHDFLEHSHNTEQNRLASGSRKMAGSGAMTGIEFLPTAAPVAGIGAFDLDRFGSVALGEFGGLPLALDDAVTTKPPMPALKQPAHITLAEGLGLLESHLSTEQAKTRLKQAFVRGVLDEAPRFTFAYDQAEIDWTTGEVKLPRKPDRFCPTFLRADFDSYFFEDREIGARPPPAPLKDAVAADTGSSPQPKEMLTLKLAFMGMSLDLKELVRRAKTWWERQK